ncbi:SixA phosphatase family protein [Roseobacter sp. CCS2]|uniref:SixA phosphatase family protein n=1 Tax=Roseobacter sp. CCS2 TaxID=391593 RepID=UPI0000F3E4B0|nr:histidine phosphatase family protein [Roseobacter sp. CCS2]EBA11945.1 phosphoglycerate mutase, putative [Roseobacter sp. CCS2]
MTLRLILIRHAKSSWSDPFGDDHERTLNKRGRASATAIGEWMAQEGYLPDTVLCSDAARTRETAALILSALDPEPRLQLSGRIYHAAPDTILEMVQKQTDQTIAVVGHNPGIGMLANGLVRSAPDHRRFSDYPTCASTVIDFDIGKWTEVQPRTGQCKAFVVPRDLIGTANHDIE